MTNPITPVKLSKGSTLLLHLVRAGHVWRDDRGFWMASTVHNKRNVHLRIVALVRRGLVATQFDKQFPQLTELGSRYVDEHPLDNVLEAMLT